MYAIIRTADNQTHGTPHVAKLLELLPDPTAVVAILQRSGETVHIPVRAITSVTVSDR